MTNSVVPDQTAPIGTVCSGSTLFASILNSSVMLGNYLQQTTFSDAFFLVALRVKDWLRYDKYYYYSHMREDRSGSVVESSASDREVAGLSLAGRILCVPEQDALSSV